jgi:hypothetical protein
VLHGSCCMAEARSLNVQACMWLCLILSEHPVAWTASAAKLLLSSLTCPRQRPTAACRRQFLCHQKQKKCAVHPLSPRHGAQPALHAANHERVAMQVCAACNTSLALVRLIQNVDFIK